MCVFVYMHRLDGCSQYLAARELSQVRFELLADHRIDSHQTEHAGLANTTLCVVIALQTYKESSGTTAQQEHANISAGK